MSNPTSLEMVLTKGRFSFGRDFSEERRRQLIEQAATVIQKAGEQFHKEILIDYIKAENGSVNAAEVKGPMGLYARVHSESYPDRKSEIRVSVPLNPELDGLRTLNDTEIVRMGEELVSLGYKQA